ncbi:IclR family transcriptional regulator [Microbacterium gubbeenense]|uniref:IclR family transcriptional regulator n=1 Tax=Microbacterium gubbeenense TaxID=159896 RepID=UPI003F949D0D
MQSIDKAILALELISQEPRSQKEIADVLEVHRSTALRIMRTLSESGLVRRIADGRYGLGYRLIGLAKLAEEQFDLVDVARPHLEEFSAVHGHTLHLATYDGYNVVYADKVEQPNRLRLFSQIGRPVRAHVSGVAKAFLAFQADEVIEQVLSHCEFEAYTPTTLTSRDAYMQELANVRNQGWGVDDGEFEDYISCVAMPVHGPLGDVVAAVSITELKVRTDLETLKQLLPELGELTQAISKELGWKQDQTGSTRSSRNNP